MYGIARNLSIDYWRRKRLEPVLIEDIGYDLSSIAYNGDYDGEVLLIR